MVNRREYVRIHDDIDISLTDIRAVTVRETDDGQSVESLWIHSIGDSPRHPGLSPSHESICMEGFEAVMFDALLKHVLRDNMTATVRGPEKLERTTYIIGNCRYVEYIRDGSGTIMFASVNWADGTNKQFDGSNAYAIFNKMTPTLAYNAMANADTEAEYLTKYRGHPAPVAQPAETRPPGIGDLTWGTYLSYKHLGGKMAFAEWNRSGHDTAEPMPDLDTPPLHAGNAQAFLDASREFTGAPPIPRPTRTVESDGRDPLLTD